MKQLLPIVTVLLASPSVADENRQLDAHEHGVGTLNVALSGSTLAMEFHAPGADIVGFEHAAESDEDKSAIEKAIDVLAHPEDIFVLADAAGCSVSDAAAMLEGDAEHDDHDAHSGEDSHDHDQHADDDHDGDDDHDHDEHADHDDHDHDEHAEEGEHDHAEGTNHTEFHAEYQFSCADPSKLSEIRFAYFDLFENAREVGVQIVTESGAQAFEVTREQPILDVSSVF